MPVASEKQEERIGDRFMALLGYVEIRFSQPRNTMQSPGIPDRRYMHPETGHAVWWEAKREGGKQTPAQKRFQQLCEICGEVYLCGPSEVLLAYMQRRAQDP